MDEITLEERGDVRRILTTRLVERVEGVREYQREFAKKAELVRRRHTHMPTGFGEPNELADCPAWVLQVFDRLHAADDMRDSIRQRNTGLVEITLNELDPGEQTPMADHVDTDMPVTTTIAHIDETRVEIADAATNVHEHAAFRQYRRDRTRREIEHDPVASSPRQQCSMTSCRLA